MGKRFTIVLEACLIATIVRGMCSKGSNYSQSAAEVRRRRAARGWVAEWAMVAQ